jgi:hypothetical protein
MTVTPPGTPEPPDPTTQALLKLVPKVGVVLAEWRQETYQRDLRRVTLMSEAAADEVDLASLLDALHTDEALSDMFRMAVEAATQASSEAKLKLLGKALASGALAEDDAAVEEAQQLLRAAVELDPVDLRALLALRGTAKRQPRVVLQEWLGTTEAVAWAVMARLLRVGLVDVERDARVNDPEDATSDFVDIQENYAVTPTGEALLELLEGTARE